MNAYKVIKLIVFCLFNSSFLLDLILFKWDSWKICGLDFGSIYKCKLGVNKYFSWNSLNTYNIFSIFYFKKELYKFFISFYMSITT